MFNRVANYLSGVGVDKYIHFNACLFIAFVASVLMSHVFGVPVAAAVGFCLTMLVGVVKELLDARIDKMDIVADALGTFVGCLMSLV